MALVLACGVQNANQICRKTRQLRENDFPVSPQEGSVALGFQSSGSQLESFPVFPRRHLVTFCCHNLEEGANSIGVQWVESRNAAKHLTMQKI